MKSYYLLLVLLIGVSVHVLGCDRKPSQDLAWQGLLANIDYNRSVYEEGVFVLSMREEPPQPLLYELGRIPLNKWLEGIRAYGVRFKKGNKYDVQETYTASFPSGLHQVKTGDDKGNFTNAAGDIIVPGVEYFSDLNKKERALKRLRSIEDYMDNEVQEIELELNEINAFSIQIQGISNKEVFEVAIKAEKWGVVRIALEGLVRMTAEGKDAQVDAGEVLPKCMNLPSTRIRRSAAMCACQVKDERLCEPLIALLDDENPKVRFTAINALVKQGDKRAIAKIKHMADNDPALPVRQWSSIAAQYIEGGIEF